MSINAYQRAAAREAKYWSPFNYSFMFTAPEVSDRVIIFGLYANSLNNQSGYLVQVEETELVNIVNSYNEKIAELNAQQVMVLNDIITKQYLAKIEKQVHDNKLITMQANIDSDSAEWDAKIAALSVDRAALTTQAAHVASETLKTNAKIQELQALIAAEAYNASEVDIEIAQKQLQSARVDVDIMNAHNEILKYQIDIVNAAIELIGVQESTANTQIRIQEMERAISRTDILDSDLRIEQKKSANALLEEDLAASRSTLADNKQLEIDDEVTFYKALKLAEPILLTAKQLDQTTEKTNRENAIADHAKVEAFNNTVRSDAVTLAQSEHTILAQETIGIEANQMSVMLAESTMQLNINDARLAAAAKMATAEVITKLTHTIQKKG